MVAIGLLFVFTAFAKDCPQNSTLQSIEVLELNCRAIVYHNNGNVEIIGNYKNGEREGKWKWYRESGKLEQIENFKNGKGRRRMESPIMKMESHHFVKQNDKQIKTNPIQKR